MMIFPANLCDSITDGSSKRIASRPALTEQSVMPIISFPGYNAQKQGFKQFAKKIGSM